MTPKKLFVSMKILNYFVFVNQYTGGIVRFIFWKSSIQAVEMFAKERVEQNLIFRIRNLL